MDSKDFPNIPFPASYASDFRVHFDPEVYGQINDHVKADTSHEVGGILVGTWQKDENGPYVTVTAMIRCDKAVGKEGEVTFTHETWNDIAREMDTTYVDFQIVGWYHSHPGFGVFLSERDLFIQEHFFSNAGQIALVIDPVSETEGVFYWKDGKVTAGEYFWVGESVNLSRKDNADPSTHPKMKLSDSPEVLAGGGSGGMSCQTDAPLLGNSWFSVLILVTLCLFMFVLGGKLMPTDGLNHEQRILEGTLLDYCFLSGKRPGLELYLLKIRQDIFLAMDEVEKLKNGEVIFSEDADGKETKQQLKPVDEKRLAKLIGLLDTSNAEVEQALGRYCLTEKEKLAVLQQIEMNLDAVMRIRKAQEEQAKKEQEKAKKKEGKKKKPAPKKEESSQTPPKTSAEK